ncbi:hypothetical protein ACKLNR_002675 [Fusarium oxysporum f. sp. zingiberi]
MILISYSEHDESCDSLFVARPLYLGSESREVTESIRLHLRARCRNSAEILTRIPRDKRASHHHYHHNIELVCPLSGSCRGSSSSWFPSPKIRFRMRDQYKNPMSSVY